MDELVNLRSLKDYEEKLREESLAIIAADPDLKEQMWMIEGGMDVVMGFTKEHKKLSDDGLTIQSREFACSMMLPPRCDSGCPATIRSHFSSSGISWRSVSCS